MSSLAEGHHASRNALSAMQMRGSSPFGVIDQLVFDKLLLGTRRLVDFATHSSYVFIRHLTSRRFKTKHEIKTPVVTRKSCKRNRAKAAGLALG